MSRRDEVESEMKEALRGCDDGMEYAERLEDKCLLLADEVHAERAVVTKLLAMLNPGEEPTDYQFCFSLYPERDFRAAREEWKRRQDTYTRACEIAGRRE